jgi:hypothetical protein
MNDIMIVLPMAFVMVAGPQIVTAILLATSVDPRRASVFFLIGAAIGTGVGVGAAYLLTGQFTQHAAPSVGDDQVKRVVEFAIVILLLILAWRVFQGRHNTDPPKWMAKLQTATPEFALKVGVFMFLVMPSDLMGNLTVGAHLAHIKAGWGACLLFVALTVLMAATPLLVLIGLGDRAATVLPRIRDWTTAHSWMVSELVIGFFLVMTLKSLFGG